MELKPELIDVKAILRRRIKIILFFFVLIFIVSTIIAFSLPSIYRSEVTIMVEQPKISEDYVKSLVVSHEKERIKTITENILSRSSLLEIIQRFDLYPEMKAKNQTTEILQKIRKSISFNNIYTNVPNPRSGNAIPIITALVISYEGTDPVSVQNVTNAIADRFIEEDFQSKGANINVTTSFFKEELENLKTTIREQEEEIQKFKQAHLDELPEHQNMYFRALERYERELDGLVNRMQVLQERKIYLQGQLGIVDPLLPIQTEQGKAASNPKERLKSLRLKLISLQSALSDKHPDIKKLKSEIRELEATVGESDEAIAKIKRLETLKAERSSLLGKLGSKHPDIIKINKEIELLSSEIDTLVTEKAALTQAENKPDNPLYINLTVQLATIESEMKSILSQQQKARQSIENYQQKLGNIPLVEKEYNELRRDYESTRAKYREMMNKYMEAKIAQEVEVSQAGGGFSVMESAALPDKPYKPNRIAIAVVGFIVAFGTGLGVAALQETLDKSIKSVEELKLLTGVAVFSTVSMIETAEERRAQSRKRLVWTAAVATAVVLLIVFVNWFLVPLDVLWVETKQRIISM